MCLKEAGLTCRYLKAHRWRQGILPDRKACVGRCRLCLPLRGYHPSWAVLGQSAKRSEVDFMGPEGCGDIGTFLHCGEALKACWGLLLPKAFDEDPRQRESG